MTDSQYIDRAEAALAAIERGCDAINDATEADIDNQRVGGMVTMTFEDGSQIIVNLQKPLEEIWLAARSGGYHYRWREGAWLDTKSDAELFDQLSRDASAQAVQPVNFSP